MEMKVAATCMHWSQPVVSSQSPSSQALASSISSPSKRRTRNDSALVCHFVHQSDRSAFFGRKSSQLVRTVSCEIPKSRNGKLRRTISAGFDNFSDEEFAENIRELALRFHLFGDENEAKSENALDSGESSSGYCGSFDGDFSSIESSIGYAQSSAASFHPSKIDSTEPPWLRIRPEPSYWPGTDEINTASIERKANSVDIPLSLRIIKKKNQWKEDFREAGETAYCSVKKAFSSMVFIIRELHSYTLQMREFLYLEDVQGILARVQKEIHASFVWLFSQIFSHTPTLMMYVMILMANFTVHSMSNNVAIAAPASFQYYSTTATTTESVSSIENHEKNPMLDSSQIKTFSDSSISVGGNSGGGGKVKRIGSGTDGGDGRFDGVSTFHHHTIVPDEVSQVSSFGNPTTSKEDEAALVTETQEEMKLWNSIVEEASKMQAVLMGEAVLDHETMQRFVSPVEAKIEPEDFSNFFRTELKYQQAVSQEPNNPLLLANYAQFLFLVIHDHDRAEKYFKRASQVKPADAEALSKFASFLWIGKKDMDAAEETYLEAIEADPGNAYHAANYAHFLWNTGGEDTCYPLSS
ncbi:hypothetical protein IFM89_031455 [Coptis chinensis]|uniref:Tetratricopeptide repeat-like superfamily protein n=1 Tax=Coptis chinensis TaxID=261450 RepID=A0A835HI95_9MAGN|nr:hypothetical protein IFM89_031455 [Coptis chinensis]